MENSEDLKNVKKLVMQLFLSFEDVYQKEKEFKLDLDLDQIIN